MSDPKLETSPSEAVTSEDVERQIRVVTDPLIQQSAHLFELMKELRDAHTQRRHEETTFSRATSSSIGGTGRPHMVTGTLNPAFMPLSTHAPHARLTSPQIPPNERTFSVIDGDRRKDLTVVEVGADLVGGVGDPMY